MGPHSELSPYSPLTPEAGHVPSRLNSAHRFLPRAHLHTGESTHEELEEQFDVRVDVAEEIVWESTPRSQPVRFLFFVCSRTYPSKVRERLQFAHTTAAGICWAMLLDFAFHQPAKALGPMSRT